MTATRAQRHALLTHPAGWIALGFGSGLSPIAPGTAGSLAALVPWLLLRELPWPAYLAMLAIAFALGVWACAWCARRVALDDPSFVVWDEFVGQWIALVPLLWRGATLLGVVAAFVLFRLFDVAKPWPVSWADRRVHGGLGIMLDDVFAGVYAALTLLLVTFVVR